MKAELETVTEMVRGKIEVLQDNGNLLDVIKLNKVLDHLEKANEAYNEYYTSHIKEVN